MDNTEDKQSQKASIDLLVEQLKPSSFATRYAIQIKVDRIWSISQKPEVARSLTCFVKATNSEEISELNKIEEAILAKVDEDETKYAILQDFQFVQSLKVGDKLPIYSNFLSVFKESPEEIRHQAGEVLLIDVWATWCGPCQAPMQHNLNMLEKNAEKWGDQVRIIAVSVDEERQEVMKRITDRKWEKIIHYKLKGWDGEHPMIKDFDIKGIPFVALVDTNGILNYVGHPSEGNLEDRITTLLERKGIDTPTTDLSLDQYKKLKNLVEKDFPKLVESNEAYSSLEYSLKFSKISVIKPKSEENTYQQPSYISSYDRSQVTAYKEFKKNLTDLLGETFPLKKECEQFKDVKQGVIADLKELKQIFETQQLKNIETQHKVTIKLKLKKEEGILIYKRSEAFLQYSQLVVQDEATKKQVDVASGQIKGYFLSKFRNGEYADYLQKFFQMGIVRVDDSQKLVPKHEIDETAYRKFKEILESKHLQDLQFKLDLPYDIKLRLRLCRHRVFDYQGNMKFKQYDKPIIKYQVRSDHEELVKTAVIDQIFASVDESTFVLKPKILNVVKMETGKVCAICQSEISVPQYYNYFKQQHLCLACGDKCDESKNTIERFSVPDNLLLFNSNEAVSIEEYKLGKNTQPDKDTVVSLKFNFCCSACQKGGNQGRFICLSCRPGPLQQDGYIEFCQDCHKKLVIDKDTQLLEQVQLNEPNHKLEHLLLNVRTSAGSYYNY